MTVFRYENSSKIAFHFLLKLLDLPHHSSASLPGASTMDTQRGVKKEGGGTTFIFVNSHWMSLGLVMPYNLH